MPQIKLPLTRSNAALIHDAIDAMSGPEEYMKARAVFRSEIGQVWPEIFDAAKVTPPEETREVDFTEDEQQAMAEGFLILRRSHQITDGQRRQITELGKACKVSGWVEKHLPKTPLKPFRGLDGEPELLDASEAPAPTPVEKPKAAAVKPLKEKEPK